ncbi:MAG: esterase-like activity of phytase family protein, partial [Enhydrobacter sp.]
PDNGGVEALTALSDGRIVAISEEYSLRRNTLVGWIGRPIGPDRYLWDMFEYMKIPNFSPTAIRELPDGSFVVLERAFDMVRGVRVRVMQFPGSALKADAIVDAEELARLASPYAVDNLEGLAATTGERGETLLWMIADDNFNPLQRSLLLLFELAK